jgi:hypothetical protein
MDFDYNDDAPIAGQAPAAGTSRPDKGRLSIEFEE